MLKSIKTIKCPHCGCEDIIEEKVNVDYDRTEIREHCNGTRWEHRNFLCGYKIDYIPNFSKESESMFSECKNDPKLIAQIEEEKKEKEHLLELLKSNNISQNIIDKLTK